MKNLILLFVILGIYTTRGDYIGAVVEVNTLPGDDPTLRIEQNINAYVNQIAAAKESQAQIIVFPEYGLTGLVDDPENYAITIPAVGTSNFSTEASFSALLRLSSAANEQGMYVVANFLEKETDDTNVTLYYNTNVVFASNGTLVAKYRKINLFAEPKLTPGTELSTFTTNFGTFGLFTCMDILYYHPAQTILKDTGVESVIYPAAWTSIVPFYMSLEVQVGYATANKVHLLAANLNSPTEGRGGSSIVSRDGVVLGKVLTDQPQTFAIYATLQTTSTALRNSASRGFDIFENETRAAFSNYKNITDFNYQDYTFKKVDLSVENFVDEICHSDFCCSFNLTALQNETNTSEVYQLVAYDGPTQFDNQTVNIKFCALVACLSDDTASCGLRPENPYTTTFREITVWNQWAVTAEEFSRPISLRGNLDSVYNASYLASANEESASVSYNITLPHDNVVIFGVYVRTNGVAGLTAGVSLLLVAVLVAAQAAF